ncbi:MAG: hypothetical protein GY754_42260 [bacterium]|nr:hypothetical protein [bacterium]
MKLTSSKKISAISRFSVLALVFVPLASVSLMAKPGDPLWKKAVKIAKANENLVPHRIKEHEKIFDSGGKLEESSISTYSFVKDPKKLFTYVLKSSVKDGKDYTAEKKKELKEYSDKDIIGNDEENPFDPRVQNSVSIKRTGKTAVINNRKCVVFRYSQKTKETTWNGTVWLDAKSGAPLKLAARPRKMISEKDFKTRSMLMVISFDYSNKGSWFPKIIYIEMDISVNIMPLVTFDGKVKSTISLSSYSVFK